ncbi:hypothetical protein FDECE_3452 [Neofusicoccum parvum]|nr:hypothetical protein FDECE_3452 [Neofusicoccum parvum]
MAKSTFVALFAVSQSTTDVDAQVEFYKGIGFVVDDGYTSLEGSFPDVIKSALTKSVALRLPNDPYMHLILHGWNNLKTTPGWPAPFNQIGTRGITMLVKDVAAELERIKAGWPHLRIHHGPLSIRRKWGATTSALLEDPEGVFLELLEISSPSPFDAERVQAPGGRDRTWLHFMHNCADFHATRPFYEAFGMAHDRGVDFRPNTGFHPWGVEHFTKQMADAFGFEMAPEDAGEVAFLRAESDCSQMHLELLNITKGLQVPGPRPTWLQNGISRYCIKTKDYAGALRQAKEKGTKIYIEDQRGCLNWGDSQWFFFADVDGNIVTLEEWFPHREWGERE